MSFPVSRLVFIALSVVAGPQVAVRAVTVTQAEASTARDHVIMLQEDGTFVDPTAKWPTATEEFAKFQTIEEQLNHIQTRIAREQQRLGRRVQLLVFVHGGLTSYSSSFESYVKQREALEKPNETNTTYYPLFIVWKSGLRSTYWEHLTRIRQGEVVSRFVGGATAPIVFLNDLASGLVRAPVVLPNQIATDWRTTEFTWHWRARAYRDVEQALTQDYPGLVIPGEDQRTTRERMRYLLNYVTTLPFKLVTAPLIDGFGSRAWDNMLRRTGTMFDPPPHSMDIIKTLKRMPAEAGRQQAIESWLGQGRRGVMLAVSERLEKWSQPTEKGGLCGPIDLFGHSMGTIVLNRVIQTAPNIQARRIGYLAAACSIREWQETVLVYLGSAAGKPTQFYSLSLHRMREGSERNPQFLELAPRGSLLNWIDNFLARPLTIRDRTLGSWENIIRAVPQIDRDVRPRVHLRAFHATRPGPTDQQPQRHGEFDDYEFWRDDYLFPESPHRALKAL